MITSLYAALLGLFLVVLSVRVIALRGNPLFRVFAFANHGPETLQRAIRGHGNLTEYAPIMLIVMFLAEYQGMAAGTLHLIGGTFLVARLMHGICFCFLRYNMILRVGGTALSLGSLITACIQCLRYFTQS